MLSILKSKKTLFIIAIIMLGLFLISIPSKKNTPAKPIKPDPVRERQVLAYFYYWYDLPDGTHSMELTDFPSDKNTSYKKVEWFRNQLIDMEKAGIDTALIVYWSRFEPGYKEGLKNLIQAREELLSEKNNPPKIGLFLDTGFLDRLEKNEKNFIRPEGQKIFYGFIKEFFDQIKPAHWGLIEERPIIWLWGNWFPFEYNQSTFDFVYENFRKDFGIKPYIVREAGWNFSKKQEGVFGKKIDYSSPIKTDDVYIWGSSLDGYKDADGNIATIGPGYDERELSGSDRRGRFVDRDNGEWFSKNFKKALASGKSILVIETWNEFHEANEVADSEKYGKFYINLTKYFSDQWHMSYN